jgi:GDP/UDP-N,N'-diacetylbacillosamine 2-epimerase (hydrolysing)
MLKIGILSSSRADFGIYEPLVKAMIANVQIEPEVIAFGTHLSPKYGNSIDSVVKTGVKIAARFNTVPSGDTPEDIVKSMATTMNSLAPFWSKANYDLVLALGDRYEMFAAVASTLPFNIRIGHIHGGETTLGAIDNALRHSITHMASLHFASAEAYRLRIIELLGNDKGVYCTGALSVDSLASANFMSTKELNERFGIDFSLPTMLITLHPETIGYERTESNIAEVLKALKHYGRLQKVITMPNADTSGLKIRKMLEQYSTEDSQVFLIENFGSAAYLSAMKYCTLMLGNTSSGFIEAAWFPKWVVNIGNRQNGRLRTPNIIDAPFEAEKISAAIEKTLTTRVPDVKPVYGDGNASKKIIKYILDEHGIN